MTKLAGSHVLISGGSKGIGAGIALPGVVLTSSTAGLIGVVGYSGVA